MSDNLNTKNPSCEKFENDYEVPTEDVNLRFSSNHIELVLKDLCSQGKNGLREVDITYAYIDWLRKYEKIEYSYTEKQPTVHTALKKLVKLGAVKQIDRKYYLIIPDSVKDLAEKAMISQVRLEDSRVFTISASTVVLHPTYDTVDIAKKELRNFLGNSCYGIVHQDGFLLIMLIGNSDKLKELRDSLKILAKRIGEKQHK